MNSGHDVVVTNLNISQKEQELKQRFLNNTRPEAVKTTKTAAAVQDPGVNLFLEEMQSTLKQQATSTAAEELLKQQAIIMQQQVDLLRGEQKNFHQVIKQISKPVSEDPKRLLAELLAPLNKQIIEVKSYYEETKNTAKDIVVQVNDLKKAINGNKSSVHLQKNVEDGMKQFAQKKAMFEHKVKEAESMVSDVINDAEEKINFGGCKQGIDYLRQQIEAVHKDAEKIEIELQNRFQRIVQQVQKIKSVPEVVFAQDSKSSDERITILLGGTMNYEEILSEVESITTYKNQLIQEYKKNTPVYPKLPKPVITQVIEKKPQKKPVVIHPIPSNIVKKTFKTKPTTLQNILTQPKQIKPKVEKPKSLLEKEENLLNIEQIIEKPVIKYKPEVVQEKINVPGSESFKEAEASPRSEVSYKHVIEKPGTVPRAPSPEPFQTKPGVTKGEQTAKKLTFTEIYPSLKNIETQEPPQATLEQRTIDAVTGYILSSIIKPEKKAPEKIIEPQPNKWLGVEELSELTRLGIYIDPITIDRIGREVLTQNINRIKYESKETITTNKNSLLIDDTGKEFITKSPISIPKKPELIIDEPEDKYESDFEENSSEKKDQEKETLFDKISPKTPPQMYEKRFDQNSLPQTYEKRFDPVMRSSNNVDRPEENINSLLDPRMFGMMSASSIQQYVTALIESGHLSKPQDTPSFFTRSPTPGTQTITTPQYKPTSDTTMLESKVPEEFKDFVSTKIGSQILKNIKENPAVHPQKVIESWVLKQISNPSHMQTPQTEEGIFGKPQNRGAKLFDLESEEKKLFEENSTVRHVIKIPVLELHKNSESLDSAKIITDSEVSGLSQSGSIGSEIFNIENPEFMSGFMEFVRKARELEEGQLPGNSDLSEGEVRLDYEGLSSGEIPKEPMNPLSFNIEKSDRLKFSTSGLLSDEGYELSEGEFDPHTIFKV
jgi:hypothetical protein